MEPKGDVFTLRDDRQTDRQINKHTEETDRQTDAQTKPCVCDNRIYKSAQCSACRREMIFTLRADEVRSILHETDRKTNTQTDT